MPLNADIPPIECFVRKEFMRQHKDSHGEVMPCMIFGVTSLQAQTPLFHFQTEDGGIWWRMPISAFCHRATATVEPLEELVLWDCFSYAIEVHCFALLKNARMEYRSRSGVTRGGRYLFTLDWFDGASVGFSEQPGQHKCGHVIELEDGNYAIQPNNRLLSFNASWTTKYGEKLIERLLADRVYTVEQFPKWLLSSDERYDFEIEQDHGVKVMVANKGDQYGQAERRTGGVGRETRASEAEEHERRRQESGEGRTREEEIIEASRDTEWLELARGGGHR